MISPCLLTIKSRVKGEKSLGSTFGREKKRGSLPLGRKRRGEGKGGLSLQRIVQKMLQRTSFSAGKNTTGKV